MPYAYVVIDMCPETEMKRATGMSAQAKQYRKKIREGLLLWVGKEQTYMLAHMSDRHLKMAITLTNNPTLVRHLMLREEPILEEA